MKAPGMQDEQFRIATATVGARPYWVEEVLQRLESRYLGAHGVLVSVVDGQGVVLDGEPLVADLGDVLPFAWHFGRQEFAYAQVAAARPFLQDGLYCQGGRVRLFSNHDWLLGLLDLFRQSGDAGFLELAVQGAGSIEREFFAGDLLVDESPRRSSLRSALGAASPFNCGFAELWVDLFRYTGDEAHLATAVRVAGAWVATEVFVERGIFGRLAAARLPQLGVGLDAGLRQRASFFKDNTNAVWAILALWNETRDARWREALVHWVAGFERAFFNGGEVWLHLDRRWHGTEPSLKAAFSSVDLLCDLQIAGVEAERALRLATAVADHWLLAQWSCGLFPEEPGADRDHLDANVDFVVALTKLCALTGQSRYRDAARRCAAALLARHAGPQGYCLAVDRQGRVVDPRIVVKYQGLLLKLALLPADPAGMLRDSSLLELLRDR